MQFKHLHPQSPSTLGDLRALVLNVVLGLFFSMVFVQASARAALDTDSLVDGVVDALVVSGEAAGVPISPDEGNLVKPIVKCAIHAKPILDCAKDFVAQQLPDGLKQVTPCLLSGDALSRCVQQELIGRLPDGAQPMARCLLNSGGDAVGCAKQFATDTLLNNIPQPAQGLVRCMGSLENVADRIGECAKQQAINALPLESQAFANCIAKATGGDLSVCAALAKTEAERVLLNTAAKFIDKNTPHELLASGTSPIENIICAVNGIAEENWTEVLRCGGKAAAKYGIHLIVSTLATPAISSAASPLIDYLVDNRSDTAIELANAAVAGDAATVVRIGAEIAILNAVGIEEICAFIPDGAVKEATCGNVGKLIRAAAKGLQEGVTAVVDESAAGLKAIGGVVSDGVDYTSKKFAGKDDNCGSPAEYYANNYASCTVPAASLWLSNASSYVSYSEEKYWDCRRHFIHCEFSDPVSNICDPMKRLHDEQVRVLQQAMTESSAAYARSLQKTFKRRRGEICSPSGLLNVVSGLAGQCDFSVAKAYPQSQGSCPEPTQLPGILSAKAGGDTCRQATLNEIERIRPKLCEGAGQCFPVGSNTGSPSLSPSGTPGKPGLLRDLVSRKPVLVGEGDINWDVIDSATKCPRGLVKDFKGKCACLPGLQNVTGADGKVICCVETCKTGEGAGTAKCGSPTVKDIFSQPPPLVAGAPKPEPPVKDIFVQPPLLITGVPKQEPSFRDVVSQPPRQVAGIPKPDTLRSGGSDGVMPSVRCPASWSGEYPVCCQPGTVYDKGACVEQAVILPPCPRGWDGVYPNCCQPGFLSVGGNCKSQARPQPAIPATVQPCGGGMIGTPPNCRCRNGQRYRSGQCQWLVRDTSPIYVNPGRNAAIDRVEPIYVAPQPRPLPFFLPRPFQPLPSGGVGGADRGMPGGISTPRPLPRPSGSGGADRVMPGGMSIPRPPQQSGGFTPSRSQLNKLGKAHARSPADDLLDYGFSANRGRGQGDLHLR